MNLPVVVIRNLGRLSYTNALSVQKEASHRIIEHVKSKNFNSIRNYLFLLEHNPVYTVGIRHKEYETDVEKLKQLGADFIYTDRGGLITFHGPGQLVSYPVIYLGNFNAKKSIKWYVKQLENTIISVCNYYSLKAHCTGDVGVWIDDRKVAAVGIHGSRYVTTHGVAVNCNTDLSWFSHIVPCGLEGKEVTSLSKELGRNVTVEEVIPKYLEAFQQHFPCRFVYDEVS